jgi:two-component sensor histidine kinase
MVGNGVVCYFRDISAEVQARQTQQLLVDELNHRVKNTLAGVQALVQHTLRNTKDPADFAASFAGRIQSMARVHALLSADAWKGAELRDIIRDQLLLGAVDETRLSAWGPAVRLEPRIALHFALMLHELRTNSVKYGALSTPQGRVTIKWTVDVSLLRLKWMERGGPVVSAPVRRGFGTTFVEQSASGEGGEARMSCTALGITWEITLPLPRPGRTEDTGKSAVQPVNAAPKRAAEGATCPNPSKLFGRRILVVEDEPLVMLDLVSALREGGAELAGTASTEAAALQIIESQMLDGALLDCNLRGKRVDQAAAALTRHQVPFLFVTGYGRESLPLAFGNAKFLGKPFTQQQLLDATAQLVEKKR